MASSLFRHHEDGVEQGDQSGAEHRKSDTQQDFREGGYGWVVVACVALINAHTWGYNSSFAVFLAYYLETNAFPGATPLQYAFVGGLSISLAFFVSPLVTATIRVFGTRPAFFIGVAMQTAGFIGASFTTQLWHLILSQGVAFGFGMGFCYTSTAGLPPQWFKERRALANGIATGGSGLGGLTYSLATNKMIEQMGLAWTFRVLAIVGFVALTSSGILLRDRNKAIGSVFISFDWKLYKRKDYWLFLGWAWFSSLGYLILLFSLADFVQDAGFTASQGSIVAAMFSLSTGIGRPLIGVASDRFGSINVTAVATLISSLAAFLLWILGGRSYAALIIYGLFGALCSVMWATFAPVAAEVVGLQLLPSAISLTLMGLVVPYTFAEPIALSIRQPGNHGYLYVQIFVGIMYIIAFICVCLLRLKK